jgi:uncharacterized protein YodC (DUF2158 family)
MSYLKMMQKVRGESLRESGVMGVGELVRLKSGGPVMVVEQVREDGSVGVTWMDKEGVAHANGYAVELLERYEGGLRRWAS